jgi:ribosomal protein S18 acetylase RimI-like enzyme
MSISNSKNIAFKAMQVEHIAAVARLHYNELPEDYCSLLGLDFLEKIFYKHFLGLDKKVGLVVLEQQEVVGFIASAKAKGYYSAVIKKNLFPFLWYVFKATLRNPKSIIYSFIVVLIFSGINSFRPEEQDAELLYIAVSKKMQGRSIGGRLIEKTMDPLRRLGFNRYVTKTIESTEQTNRFYIKNKFTVLQKAIGRVWYSRGLVE